jgi:esterase/lipase superfamily enzyme/TRAP-type C4-dicarboxylate transport system substrate-binding protein
MPRLLTILASLLLASSARAAEVRLAFPAAYADDVFVKSLLSNPALAQAGLNLTPQKRASESDALQAAQTGATDLAVFTLAANDLRKLKKSGAITGDETSLLTRPFMFKSADELVLMQKSFIGEAAAVDAGRSGLFPLTLWNHSVTYLLTRDPVHSAEDFSKLKVAAEHGAPDARVLSALGAKSLNMKPAMDRAAKDSAMKASGMNALETQLGAATQDFAAKFGAKLYLTTGWPESGLLAAAPDFWLKLSEVQKNALKIAAEQARNAADAGIMAREEAFRKLPNVEMNRLDSDTQMHVAMMAGGGGKAAIDNEKDIWRKAEVEVHGQAQETPSVAPPRARMATVSPILFVTDRNDEGGADYKTRFGARRLDPFEYSCTYLGAPARHSGEPKLPPAPKTLTKGVEECARLIVEKTRQAGMSKILFIIHGFNIPFDGLVWRALQLGSDLDYQGAIVGWSWPSEGSAFSYAYDEDSSTWSEPHLMELVSAVAEAGPELQLDFVAHSMGNRMLLQMLRELALAHSQLRIGAAIFAAPDVAQDVFREQLRMVKKIGGIRTLYASEYDRAILISQSYHQAPRAGSGGADILIAPGVESIDTRVGGHSYVFDEPKAIQDFSEIVNRETAAAARGLAARDKAGAPYWVIEP